MAAYLKCTGPAYCFINLSANSLYPVYLGTAELSPRIQMQLNFEPVSNDIGGREPMDDSYQGRSALIELMLNDWDETLFARLENTNPYRAGTLRGLDLEGDVGSFVVQEGLFTPVWIVFPYGAGGIAAKPSMTDLPAGYFFGACHLANDVHEQLGTKPKKVQVVFQARRIYNRGPIQNVTVPGSGALVTPFASLLFQAVITAQVIPVRSWGLYSTAPNLFTGLVPN